MTPNYFLEDMKNELTELFEDFPLAKKISIFEQALPIPSSEDEPEPFPYAIVRLADGKLEDYENGEIMSVMIIFGAYNIDSANDGYRDVLNLIDFAKRHFLKKQNVKSKYQLVIDSQHPVNWSLPDEDSYPYYFGGLQLYFKIFTIIEEDCLT